MEENALAAPKAPRPFIHWSAPTHVHTRRSNDWYWALGVIAVCGIAACILWGNILFAIIIALAAMSVAALASRPPRDHDVILAESGIIVDHEFYPYHAVHSFWVAEHLPAPKLFISTTGIIHPHIVVPLIDGIEPGRVREFLAAFIPEEEGHSLGSWFAEVLGF